MRSIAIAFLLFCMNTNFYSQENQEKPAFKLDEIIYTPECYISDGEYRKTAFSYDHNGNLTSQATLVSAEGTEWDTLIYEEKHEYTYDEKGNILTEKELSGYCLESGMGIKWDATYKAEYSYEQQDKLVTVTEYLTDYNDVTESYIWQPFRHLEYTYRNDGNKVIYKLTVDWDDENKKWVESSYSTHIQLFDKDGRLIEVHESQDIDDTATISAAKSVRTYLNQNDQKGNTIFVKFGNREEWVKYKHTQYEYDEFHNLILAKEITYDLNTGEINDTETLEKLFYQYDENNRMITEIIYGPPYGGFEWDEKSRYLYEYDDEGLLAVKSYYQVDNYYYIETGQVDSLNLVEQQVFNYDDQGNLSEKITRNYYDYDQSLAEISRTTYTYNYSLNRNHFKTQFKTLQIPDIFDNASTWNQLMDQVLFDDRVLVEETLYEASDVFENEQGELEIKWFNPCTQKYTYSKLE